MSETLMDNCMKEVIAMFEANKVMPTSDNITQLTDTLFKAKKWGSTKFKG
jgi:hypothetical protein